MSEVNIGDVWVSSVGCFNLVKEIDGEYAVISRLDGDQPLGGGAEYRVHISSVSAASRKVLGLDSDCILGYANTMLEHEIQFIKTNHPQDLSKVTEEVKTNFICKKMDEAHKLAVSFFGKRSLYDAWNRGRFWPRNPASRELFTAVTGVQLPKTSSATDDVIKAHIGNEWVEKIVAERQQKRDEESRKKLEQAEEKHRQLLADIRERMLSDKPITGGELVEMARSVEVYVHPRTVGFLRDKVVEITSTTARIRGAKNSGQAGPIYRDTMARISAASVPCS